MELGKSGHALAHAICPIKVMCAGRVDLAMVLSAFEKGVEGVLVIGCKDQECRYGPGPDQASKMAEHLRGLMHILGLQPERFSSMKFASHEKDGLFAEIDSFAKKISRLERSPLARI